MSESELDKVKPSKLETDHSWAQHDDCQCCTASVNRQVCVCGGVRPGQHMALCSHDHTVP